MGHLSEDRTRILYFYLPFGAAFSAGAFGGAIRISGPLWRRIIFSATGGIAVWLIAHLLLRPAQPVGGLQITRFDLLDESAATPNGKGWTLARYQHRANRDFDISSPADLQIAFALEIRGFVVRPTTKISLTLTCSMLDIEQKTLVSDDVEHYDTLSEWKTQPIIHQLGADTVLTELEISSEENNSGKVVPYLILLTDFEEGRFPVGKGFLKITVKDDYSGATAYREERIEINVKSLNNRIR